MGKCPKQNNENSKIEERFLKWDYFALNINLDHNRNDYTILKR